MSDLIFDNLICGYKIIVFDFPEYVGDENSLMRIPRRITDSKIRFFMRLNSEYKLAFTHWLGAVNVKPSPEREHAIRRAIIDWVMQHHNLVFEKYDMHIEEACDGSCDCEICLEKPFKAIAN